ncbi:MAG TPA: 4'-phosphopantetheinyl transferase superfamily protein [Sphaerochaeta sp.]|nr:4'-phosphopantetheinyl transferase superfamily protein [Sphaerochaeta sp.]
MRMALGVDVVNIERIRTLSAGVKTRLFHPAELALAATMTEEVATEYLAGRFASKEALGKALGCGLAALEPATLLVDRKADGSPTFVLGDAHRAHVAGREILLSISHDSPVAVATVLLYGGSDGTQ